MENWKEQYNQLECEWKKYYKDDFAEVYKYLLEDNISIDEAIIKIGANYNAEIYQTSRDAMRYWLKAPN